MTTLALNYYKVQKNIQSKINSIELPVINWRVIFFVGFFVGMALLVFYVWQVNCLTGGSYLINDYQNQINQLSQKNKNLEISFAENSFLGQALVKIQALNFQKVTSVKYIQIPDSSIQVAEAKQ